MKKSAMVGRFVGYVWCESVESEFDERIETRDDEAGASRVVTKTRDEDVLEHYHTRGNERGGVRLRRWSRWTGENGGLAGSRSRGERGTRRRRGRTAPTRDERWWNGRLRVVEDGKLLEKLGEMRESERVKRESGGGGGGFGGEEKGEGVSEGDGAAEVARFANQKVVCKGRRSFTSKESKHGGVEQADERDGVADLPSRVGCGA